MKFNTDEINSLIKYRRSILPNLYTGEVIEESLIQKILENANWAPTHKKTEPWRFIVFKGEGLKKLAEFQSGLYRQKTESDGTFSNEKYENLRTKPLKASHVIAVAMKRDPKQNLPEIEEIEAVACAVQNMYLTAAAYGIGCYWGTGGITYWEEAKVFFGLGPDDRLLGFFYTGVPKKWPEGKRSAWEEKVTWIG